MNSSTHTNHNTWRKCWTSQFYIKKCTAWESLKYCWLWKKSRRLLDWSVQERTRLNERDDDIKRDKTLDWNQADMITDNFRPVGLVYTKWRSGNKLHQRATTDIRNTVNLGWTHCVRQVIKSHSTFKETKWYNFLFWPRLVFPWRD